MKMWNTADLQHMRRALLNALVRGAPFVVDTMMSPVGIEHLEICFDHCLLRQGLSTKARHGGTTGGGAAGEQHSGLGDVVAEEAVGRGPVSQEGQVEVSLDEDQEYTEKQAEGRSTSSTEDKKHRVEDDQAGAATDGSTGAVVAPTPTHHPPSSPPSSSSSRVPPVETSLREHQCVNPADPGKCRRNRPAILQQHSIFDLLVTKKLLDADLICELLVDPKIDGKEFEIYQFTEESLKKFKLIVISSCERPDMDLVSKFHVMKVVADATPLLMP